MIHFRQVRAFVLLWLGCLSGVFGADVRYFILQSNPAGPHGDKGAVVVPLSEAADIARAEASVAVYEMGGFDALFAEASSFRILADIVPGADGINRNYAEAGEPEWDWHVDEARFGQPLFVTPLFPSEIAWRLFDQQSLRSDGLLSGYFSWHYVVGEVSNETFSVPSGLGLEGEVATTVIYLAFIVTGLATCFVGSLIFRYVLAILLSLAGALAGLQVALELELATNTGMWIGGGAGAILGLLISFFFVKAAAAVAGGMLAYVFVAPNVGGLMEWKNMLTLGVACLAGGVVGVFLAKPTILVATAFVGAFLAVYGGLYFIDGTQLLEVSENAVETGQILAARKWPFICAVALGVIGGLAQATRSWRKKRAKD